mmetsp:Transcript_8435/g.15899  ORF Transcript_8435/g.15899 Transcript_8435/m.15899 type:complete len:204 (-) Transcript_8435:30-641(-)
MGIAGYTTIVGAVAADATTLQTSNTTYYAARSCATVNGRDGAYLYQHPMKSDVFMQCGIGGSDNSETCQFLKLRSKTNTFNAGGQMSSEQVELEQGNQIVGLAYLDGSVFGKLDRGHCHSSDSAVRAIPMNDDHCGAKHWFWRSEGAYRTLCEDENNCVGLESGQDTQAHIYHCQNVPHKPLQYTGVAKSLDGYPEACTPSGM